MGFNFVNLKIWLNSVFIFVFCSRFVVSSKAFSCWVLLLFLFATFFCKGGISSNLLQMFDSTVEPIELDHEIEFN